MVASYEKSVITVALVLTKYVLKLCLKREKSVLFSQDICLFRAVFRQYLRCKFQFVTNLPLQL